MLTLTELLWNFCSFPKHTVSSPVRTSCVAHTLYVPVLLDEDVGARGLLWPRTRAEVGSITSKQKLNVLLWHLLSPAIQPAVTRGEATPSVGPGVMTHGSWATAGPQWPQSTVSNKRLFLQAKTKTKPKMPPTLTIDLLRHENTKGLCAHSIKFRNLYGNWIQLRLQAKHLWPHEVNWRVTLVRFYSVHLSCSKRGWPSGATECLNDTRGHGIFGRGLSRSKTHWVPAPLLAHLDTWTDFLVSWISSFWEITGFLVFYTKRKSRPLDIYRPKQPESASEILVN